MNTDITPPKHDVDADVPDHGHYQHVPNQGIKIKRSDWYKKPWFVGLTISLIAAVIGGGFLFFFFSSESSQNNASVSNIETEKKVTASIATISGTVETSTDAITWQSATEGQLLDVNDHIRAMGTSRASIVFSDGSAVRLDKSTQLQLIANDESAITFSLKLGQVYSRVATNDTRTFTIVTKNERFEALGTAYVVSSKSGVNTISTFHGSVKVEPDNIEIGEGNAYNTTTKQISDIDLISLSADTFLQWNKNQDKQNSMYKDKLGILDKQPDVAKVVDKPEVVTSIELEGVEAENGIKLSWFLTGDLVSPDGVKIVYDQQNSNPTYGQHKSLYASSDISSTVVKLTDGKDYFFRVCAYRAASGTCDSYSSSLKFKAPTVALEKVKTGAVEATLDGKILSWEFAGTAPHGFKIVLSDKTKPAYPANSIQYVGADKLQTTLPDKPAGTYYVRVCKYTADSAVADGCTDYSNQLEYIVTQ